MAAIPKAKTIAVRRNCVASSTLICLVKHLLVIFLKFLMSSGKHLALAVGHQAE